MKVYVSESPKFEGERCHYSIAAQDLESTTGHGLRGSNSNCVSCLGDRDDARKLECYGYLASIKDGKDQIIRKPGLGFVSAKALNRARKQYEQRKELKKELSELNEIRALGCLGEGGLARIAELEKMLGDSQGREEGK